MHVKDLYGFRAVLKHHGSSISRPRREPRANQLSITIELVKRVVAQTRARVPKLRTI
jgi:hypothetical protein